MELSCVRTFFFYDQFVVLVFFGVLFVVYCKSDSNSTEIENIMYLFDNNDISVFHEQIKQRCFYFVQNVHNLYYYYFE